MKQTSFPFDGSEVLSARAKTVLLREFGSMPTPSEVAYWLEHKSPGRSRYTSLRLLKGVGPKTAKEIVRYYRKSFENRSSRLR